MSQRISERAVIALPYSLQLHSRNYTMPREVTTVSSNHTQVLNTVYAYLNDLSFVFLDEVLLIRRLYQIGCISLTASFLVIS